MGKVHGSLARAGKVRGQTPKVAKQDKKKQPRGRAHKRIQYNRRFVTAGIAGASYIPTVQAALPRLLGAAAPPGVNARENRRQCLKVPKLWLERKILPDTQLRSYIEAIGSSNDGTSAVFSSKRPSRAERSVDDPIREMEGMLVDEYGSNATFQLPGLLSSNVFEEEDEDDIFNFSHKEGICKLSPELNTTTGELETCSTTSNERRHCILEDVDGELEMEDVSGHPKDEKLLTGDGSYMAVQEDEHILFMWVLLTSRLGAHFDSAVRAEMFSQQPSSFLPTVSTSLRELSGFSSSRTVEYGHETYTTPQGSQSNQQYQTGNVLLPRRTFQAPMLNQTAAGQFQYPNPAIMQHPYPSLYGLTKPPDGPRRYGGDEQWRPLSNEFSNDSQRGAWMSNGRPSLSVAPSFGPEGTKLSEDSRKYGAENMCTSGSALSKAAVGYSSARMDIERERENLLKSLGTQFLTKNGVYDFWNWFDDRTW
ncbi:hypothetical protein SSX86_008279 [Deinandra increscens subsp. villosa]|uniref:40S ribosomal protein S30 n=1 Tax=Deinandra increscens subsp. villosa TaxID=3103831 RepID=A0AAP0H3X3_9ASTR